MNYRMINVAVACIALACVAHVAAQTTRPVIVSAAEWGSEPLPIDDDRKHTPKIITIHHAGVLWKGDRSPVQFLRGMQSWGQRDKNWPDLPYHFLIAPDGTIYQGRDLEYEPESNTRYPLAGNIGVEMMGHFGQQRPSHQQLESCARLTAWLCQEFKIEPTRELVRGHLDAAPGQTTCPGPDFQRYLQSGKFHTWVRGLMEGRQVTIDHDPPLPDGPTEPIPTAATQPSS